MSKDQEYIDALVTDSGWDGACYALLRRAKTAEAEAMRLRREVEDLSEGWRPLSVRVSAHITNCLADAVSGLLAVFDSAPLEFQATTKWDKEMRLRVEKAREAMKSYSDNAALFQPRSPP
jgi:hypothetical protein